jgi:hypothetical protein
MKINTNIMRHNHFVNHLHIKHRFKKEVVVDIIIIIITNLIQITMIINFHLDHMILNLCILTQQNHSPNTLNN